MDPQLINARKRARRLAMQALYQMQLSGAEAVDIERQFIEQGDFNNADQSYFHELLFVVEKKNKQFDDSLQEYIDRPFAEIDPVEKAILYIGLYELENRTDIPYRAILNEAVNLAKKFGATDGHKYINGVLDKIARNTRQQEMEVG